MKKYTKDRVQVSVYRLGRMPSTREDFKELADELLDWSELESSLDLASFPISKRYSPSKFYKWVLDSEYFADALDIARHRIGIRREMAAHRGDLDSSIVIKTMALYNSEFKALFMDKLASWRDAQENRKPITVVLESIPSSNLVPVKTREDKVNSLKE